MKKIYLLISLLILTFFARAQNTVTLESGTNPLTTFQFRYKATTPDSLNHLWLFWNGKYNRMVTMTEANLRYAPITGGSYLAKADSNTLYATLHRYLYGTDTLYNKKAYSLNLLRINNVSVATPTNGVNIFADAFANSFGFKGQNGYSALFNTNLINGTNVYYLPNYSAGTLALINGGQTFSSAYMGANIVYRTPIGTAGSDSLVVKLSGGKLGAIPASVIPTATDYIQNKYGSTSVQATSKAIASDTIRSNTALIAPNILARDSATVGVYTTPTKSILFYGHSYVAGSDATLPKNRFVNQIAKARNLTLINNGVNSTDWTNFLGSSFFNSIPSYNSATIEEINVMYGTNDVTTGRTAAQHRADVSAAIDSVRTIKGYPANKIVLWGTPYNFNTGNPALLEQFAKDDSLIAAQKGIKFVEMYHYQKNTGGNSLYTYPGLHWNNNGHANAFTRYMNVFGYTNLIGDAHFNNSITVDNKANIKYLDVVTANIIGGEFHNGKIDTASMDNVKINTLSVTNIKDSVIFEPTYIYGSIRNTLQLDTHSGIGMNSAAMQFYSNGGMNFGAGTSNYDAWTLKPINATFYIDNFGTEYHNNTTYFNNLQTLNASPTGNSVVNATYLNTQLANKLSSFNGRTATAAIPTAGDYSAISETLTNKTIAGGSNTITGISLTTAVTGILPVANGGTNTGTAGIGAINNITGRSYTGFIGTGNLVGSASPTFTGTTTTGALSSSTGSFSGQITSTRPDNSLLFLSNTATTGYEYVQISNSSGNMRLGVENSAGGGLGSGTDANAAIFGAANGTPVNFIQGGSKVGGFTTGGLFNVNSLTASQLVATDASKNLVSVTNLPNNTTTNTQNPLTNNGTVATTAYVDTKLLSGSVTSVGTATTTFTVTILTQANATYRVSATPSNVLSSAPFYINNKTTTSFDVVYLTGLTGTVAFDWILSN